MIQIRTVAVNDHGRRIGEYQTGAKLTDHDVDLLWQLHEQGYGYKRLATVFEISRGHARDIIKGRRRGQTIARWKTIKEVLQIAPTDPAFVGSYEPGPEYRVETGV